MPTIDTDDLFAIAQDLANERQATLEKQKANRQMLRNLQGMGVLKKAEEKLLEEFYPTRTRNSEDEDEGELEPGE